MIARANPETLPMMHGGKLIVDLFAGGGGWSMGAEQAFTDAGLDRYVDIAVNHDATAIACHELNHPHTRHHQCDVFEVDPIGATGGLPVGYLHASPDCTHHSKARGGKPVKKNIRGLAWVVVRWARLVRPGVITLENVEEFKDWGPLTDDDRPCPERKGRTFKSWKAALQRLGYEIGHRELKACDYGAPTTRKRLFIIARCDGKPIIWPEATHGNIERDDDDANYAEGRSCGRRRSVVLSGPVVHGALHKSGGLEDANRAGADSESDRALLQSRRRVSGNQKAGRFQTLKPYRTAAECIDWSLPACSIFATKDEAKAWAKAHGVHSPRRPLADKTLARIAHGVMRYVVNAAEPFIVPIQNYGWGQNCTPGSEPLRTVTATPKGGAFAVADAVVAPVKVEVNHGDSGGKRSRSVQEPAGTVTGSHGAALAETILAPVTVPRHGEAPGQRPRAGRVDRPMPAVTSTANGATLVSALLTKHYGDTGQRPGIPMGEPVATITACDHHALSAAHLVKLKGTCRDGQRVDEPAPTIAAGGNHAGMVYAFLTKFYGSGGQWQGCREPLHTVPATERFNVVLVYVGGEPYVIVDICMRMLTPRELARAQGFPDEYVIDKGADGQTLSKRDQVRLIGNSVPPAFARAIVRENVVRAGVVGPAKARRRKRKAVAI